MQKIGQMAEKGFQLEDLQKAKTYFEEKGSSVQLMISYQKKNKIKPIQHIY